MGKLPNLIERLQSSLTGFDKTHEPSSRKRPERSSISAALQISVLLKIFSMLISVVTMFFIIEEVKETVLDFPKGTVKVL